MLSEPFACPRCHETLSLHDSPDCDQTAIIASYCQICDDFVGPLQISPFESDALLISDRQQAAATAQRVAI